MSGREGTKKFWAFRAGWTEELLGVVAARIAAHGVVVVGASGELRSDNWPIPW